MLTECRRSFATRRDCLIASPNIAARHPEPECGAPATAVDLRGGWWMFGDVVRAHRQRLGLSQEDLAARSGMSVRGLRKIEGNRIVAPRAATVRLLADAFGLPGEDRDEFCRDALSPGHTMSSVAGMQVRSAGPGAPVTVSLPPDVAGFRGRDDPLRRLDLLWSQSSTAISSALAIPLIVGPPGVGKTALAVHWAHRSRSRFPDGVLYENLRGYAATAPAEPIEVLLRLLTALDVPAARHPSGVAEATALYRSVLADRRMLIVLDDARTAEQVRPLLPNSPGCVVVVTSRDWLAGLVARDGAQPVELAALSPEESVALITDLLGSDRVGPEPGAVAELAELCGHLPLALRIAAASLTLRPRLSVRSYVTRLRTGNRLAELSVPGDPSVAMAAAFELSYSALPPDVRRLFRLLGLTPGPDVSIAAAAALADVSNVEARRLMIAAAAAHLVEERGEDRFALHDLLRLYARAAAERDEPPPQATSATRRLFGYYLRALHAAADLLSPDSGRLPAPTSDGHQPAFNVASALDWLNSELPNLIAAIRHVPDPALAEYVWQLADAVRGFLRIRRRTAELRDTGHAALAAADLVGFLPGQASAHLNIGSAHWALGEYPAAVTHLDQAAALARQAGWPAGESTARSTLGLVLCEQGRLRPAIEQVRAAGALARQLGPALRLAPLANLGYLHLMRGRLAAAEHCLRRALDLSRQLGNRSVEAFVRTNLGGLLVYRDRPAEAHDHLDAAMAIHTEFGDPFGQEVTHILLGGLAVFAENDPADAWYHAGRALRLARNIGDRHFEALAWVVRAAAERALGQSTAALAHYERASRLAAAAGARRPYADAMIGLARAQHARGEHVQALAHVDSALDIARLDGYQIIEADALELSAEIHWQQAAPTTAVTAAREALAIRERTGVRLGIERLHQLLALV